MTRIILPHDLDSIVQSLYEERVVVFPTETVYGIACLAESEKAVRDLFAAKGRDFSAALPVMIAEAARLDRVARPLPGLDRLAERFWPGPLTIVLPRQPWLPAPVTANGATVGVRIPDHPLALAILRQVAKPLAVSSANLSGQPPALNATQALAQLAGRVDLILDGGDAPGGQASTVIDLTTDPPAILRAGPITAGALMDVLGRTLAAQELQNHP